MVNFLTFIESNLADKNARERAITNRIRQKEDEKEKTIDTSKDVKQKAQARKQLGNLRQRSFERSTGIDFKTFSDVFRKVHP